MSEQAESTQEWVYVSSPKHRALQLVLPRLKNVRGKDGEFKTIEEEEIVKFINNGKIGGSLHVNDPKLKEDLENHPEFGISFQRYEGKGMPKFSTSSVHHGVVTDTLPLQEDQIQKIRDEIWDEVQVKAKTTNEKWRRLGELTGRLFDKNQKFKPGVTNEQKKEYELLKKELEE